MTSASIFPYKIPCSKIFLDIKCLFVNIVIHATYHINYKDGAVSSCVNSQELARTLGQDVVSLTVSAGRRNRISLHA